MVYVFDLFLKQIIQPLKEANIYISLQYHDEALLYCLKTQQEQVNEILKKGIKRVNEILKLNVEIAISIDWGYNYSECH